MISIYKENPHMQLFDGSIIFIACSIFTLILFYFFQMYFYLYIVVLILWIEKSLGVN